MSTSQYDSSVVRLQLHTLGYVPLPTRGKIPEIKGWNAKDYYDKEISPPKIKGDVARRLESWIRRFPKAHTTGVRIENGLTVIDIDCDDEAMVIKLLAALKKIAFEVWQRAPIRYGGGRFKVALFVRLEGEDFTRIGTKKYHRPNESPDKYHHVEAFGGRPFHTGKCSRQFAIDGPRSYNADGSVESRYDWADGRLALHEIALTDLPVLTKVQILELLDVFESEAEKADWIAIEGADEGSGESEDIFDINPKTVKFDVWHGADKISYEELEAYVLVHADTRVSPLCLPGVKETDRHDRCSVFWSQRFDCIVIKDWKTNARHYPVEHNPNPMTIEDFGLLLKQVAAKLGWLPDVPARQAKMEDFNAYLPTHTYVFMPTREFWPIASINDTLPPVQLFKADGTAMMKPDARSKSGEKLLFIKASQWLDRNKPLEQMTWAPGEPDIIRDRLLLPTGGWVRRDRTRVLNLYRPPTLKHGDARLAGPWVAHIRKLYHQDAWHIIRWLAHRVQYPADKINHALVLGGRPGIGKDTLLEPVKQAIGPWNMADISPKQLTETFNEFGQSVILRISEVRDLGEMSMIEFYNATKIYCAAPPDVLRINRKHVGAYYIPNACGVLMTTNYRTNCLYLEADDRRHFVAWSKIAPESIGVEYLLKLWHWYENGGFGHVAVYLATLDLNAFNAKASPRKTSTFLDIVDANQVMEGGGEMADALAKLKNPDAVTLQQVRDVAEHEFRQFLSDRKNRRLIPHRFDQCGYVAFRNSGAQDGLWVVSGVRQMVYVREELTMRERSIAVQFLIQHEDAERKRRTDILRAGIHTVDDDDDSEKPDDEPLH